MTYLAENITNAQELLVRAERGIDERSERLKESGKIVASASGQLADDAEVHHTTQLLKRAELGDGKIEETYQTIAVVKSRSGSNGKDKVGVNLCCSIGMHGNHVETAIGKSARLVEHHRFGMRQLFQVVASLHQDAQTRSTTNTAKERKRD